MLPKFCNICNGRQLKAEFQDEDLTVFLCKNCDHRQAAHGPQATDSDYYSKVEDKSDYWQSLEATRIRQAKLIMNNLDAFKFSPTNWLDFGCGRGTFLKIAKDFGINGLAGFDTSTLSRTWLKEQELIPALPHKDNPDLPAPDSIPFPPKAISLLDVVEHFPDPTAVLLDLLKVFPSLEGIIIKVPSSNGILFRVASFLRNFSPNPYKQLFQVGTAPPHFQYFSRKSLGHWLKGLPLELERWIEDSDVDNLFHRIPALGSLPGGTFAASCLRLFPRDSAIVFLRIKKVENH